MPTQSTLSKFAAACFVALVAFYLLTEHLQHTMGALPYALLLLCPLMHFFMHRGHHHPPSAPDAEQGAPHARQ